jgi:hypothetical protein
MTRLIALCLLLSGCASTRNVIPRPSQIDDNGACAANCFNYPKFELAICVTCYDRVQDECSGATHYDDGRERKLGEPVGGCHTYETKTIWVYTCKSLTHELAHADGSWSRNAVDKNFTWPSDTCEKTTR